MPLLVLHSRALFAGLKNWGTAAAATPIDNVPSIAFPAIFSAAPTEAFQQVDVAFALPTSGSRAMAMTYGPQWLIPSCQSDHSELGK